MQRTAHLLAPRLGGTFAAMATVILMTAGCGDGADQAAQLQGRTFLSEAVTIGGAPKTLVGGTRIRLSFLSDDRVTAFVGCNILGGTVSAADDRLVISDLGSTEMGCDPERHEQDVWLASVLTSWPEYQLDGSHLTLQAGDTKLQFLDREVADPDRNLQKTVWSVDGIVSGSAVSSVPAGASATIVFDLDEVRISIDGCNDASAKTHRNASTIEFEALVTTDIACAEPAARLEAAIAEVIDRKVTFAIEAATLHLTHASGKGLTLRAL
jgi:heat shock protein HslJ